MKVLKRLIFLKQNIPNKILYLPAPIRIKTQEFRKLLWSKRPYFKSKKSQARVR
uniref:Uncharacterized protein n=1 Tax=Chlamydia pneumoniae TaxID=83558 RepID=A0A0F7XNS3_CHLPN|nr:hypothetical protein BN1224_Wien2_D_00010 [Chlamydia pneumoniae]